MHHSLSLRKVEDVDYRRPVRFWHLVKGNEVVGEIQTYGRVYEVFDARLNKLHSSVTLKAAFRASKGIL